MISLLKHLRYYHIKEQNIFLFKGTVFKVAGWEDDIEAILNEIIADNELFDSLL